MVDSKTLAPIFVCRCGRPSPAHVPSIDLVMRLNTEHRKGKQHFMYLGAEHMRRKLLHYNSPHRRGGYRMNQDSMSASWMFDPLNSLSRISL